jgi:hypothetical protein
MERTGHVISPGHADPDGVLVADHCRRLDLLGQPDDDFRRIANPNYERDTSRGEVSPAIDEEMVVPPPRPSSWRTAAQGRSSSANRSTPYHNPGHEFRANPRAMMNCIHEESLRVFAVSTQNPHVPFL